MEKDKFMILVFDNEIHFRIYDDNEELPQETIIKVNSPKEKKETLLKIFTDNFESFLKFEKHCNLLSFSTVENDKRRTYDI